MIVKEMKEVNSTQRILSIVDLPRLIAVFCSCSDFVALHVAGPPKYVGS